MNNQKYLYYIFLGLVVILNSACEDLVEDVDLPAVESKLVVQSFISPQDSFILVTVSESSPVLGTVSSFDLVNFIDNATVVISDESGNKMTIPSSGGNGKYALPASSFPIMAGQTYYLEVMDNESRSAKARCTVPSSANETLNVTGFDTLTNQEFREVFVKYRFTDTPGEGDFYRVFVNGIVIDENGTGYLTIPISLYEEQTFITDKNQDGKTFLFRQSIYEDYLVSVTFLLLHSDVHYYNYHSSVERFNGDDPFSEPVLIYTNIEGGLGVFAAYNQYSLTLLL